MTVKVKSTDNINKETDDEDSDEYLLIGTWFEDQLVNQARSAPNPPPTANNTQTDAKEENSSHNSETANLDAQMTLILGATVDLMTRLLDFIRDLLISDALFGKAFAQFLTKTHVLELCNIVKDVETKTETVYLTEKFVTSFYRFVEFLIVRNLLDFDKQELFVSFFTENNEQETAEKKAHMLFVNKRYLSILCQIFVLRLKGSVVVAEKTKDKIYHMWESFFKLIEFKVEKRLIEPLNDGKSIFYNKMRVFSRSN